MGEESPEEIHFITLRDGKGSGGSSGGDGGGGGERRQPREERPRQAREVRGHILPILRKKK